MKGNRKRDTRPERALRSALHAAGSRFRIDYPIVAGTGRSIRADVAFTRQKVAVFLDGCFWHCCPEHGTSPRSNSGYWQAKLARNVERDREVDERLHGAGWAVIRVWEHESPNDAAASIRAIVTRARLRHARATRGTRDTQANSNCTDQEPYGIAGCA